MTLPRRRKKPAEPVKPLREREVAGLEQQIERFKRRAPSADSERALSYLERNLSELRGQHGEPPTPQFTAIHQAAIKLITFGARPMQLAEYFGAHLDDAGLTHNERELLRSEMREWAARGSGLPVQPGNLGPAIQTALDAF